MSEELEENLEAEIEHEQETDIKEPSDIEEPDDLLERAKKLGYKTDDEYTGNPKYKLSPKEYLERAEKGGTIKKLEADIEELRRKDAERQEEVEKMRKVAEFQARSAKERAIEELRAKQVKAIDDGDLTTSEAFEKYEKEKEKVESQYNPVSETETRQNIEPPAITQFYRENPWYHESAEMREEANALHAYIIRKHPAMSLEEQLKLVKRKVIENFPDRFENPKRKTQSIEGGNTVHGGNNVKKDTLQSLGFSSSDIEDVKRSIRMGDFKDEADFIKSYMQLNKGRK